MLFDSVKPSIKKFIEQLHNMLRILNGKTRSDHTNMQTLREELKVMSVNQLSIYHVAIEMFNIVNNASSEPLQRKMKLEPRGYQLRSLEDGKVKVPKKERKAVRDSAIMAPNCGIIYQGTSERPQLEIYSKKRSKTTFGRRFRVCKPHWRDVIRRTSSEGRL